MSKVQLTPTVAFLATIGICYELRRRPGPEQQVPADHGTVATGGNYADTAVLGGHARVPIDQAIGVRRSSATAPPSRIPGLYDVITGQRMPANGRLGERTSLRQLCRARPAAMVCATRDSRRPAFGCPRRSVGRQCHDVTLTPAGAFDLRAAVHGFSLRYPRGN